MKILGFLFVAFVPIILISCQESEMPIDQHLKSNSVKFTVKHAEHPGQELLEFGHFSAYEDKFGLAWMETSGIQDYFDEQDLFMFTTDNHDNYQYNNVLSPVRDPEKILGFAEHFGLPLDSLPVFDKAWVGYLYAPHDEYSMVFFQSEKSPVAGYLSNGFDVYQIFPVFEEADDSAGSKQRLRGYQFKLFDEYVGSIQTSGPNTFRMTNEYCDATEMVIATLASSIIECKKI